MNTEQIPKQHNADVDSMSRRGRLIFVVRRADGVAMRSAGVLVTACLQRKPDTTRETQIEGKFRLELHQLEAREGQIGIGLGVGKARSTERNRVTPVEGRSLSLGTRQEEATARRLA